MIKRKLRKYLLLIGAVIMVLAVAIPYVVAYEGHLIDVKAHETVPVTKEARLATQTEISTHISSSCNCTLPCSYCSPCEPCVYNKPGTYTAWDNIKANSCIAWIVNIYVVNPYDYEMSNVEIYDEFNANVQVKEVFASQGSVTIQNGNKLNTWWIGTLPGGGEACLSLIVWTKCECQCLWQCVSADPLPSPGVGLSCGLFTLFNDLTGQRMGCDCEYKWVCVCKCKDLKQSLNGHWYLQAVEYNDYCPPVTGILMKWDYDIEVEEEVQTKHVTYNGGQLLEITVY